jgi:NitT/TauT family transport system permease protein
MNLFTPNKFLSKKSVQILIFSQLSFLILFWFFSPFVFLPKPTEVYQSFIELWQYDALAQELITSLFLSIESILISIVVSLGLSYLSTIPFFRPAIAVVGKLRFLSLVGLSFFFTLMTSTGHQLKVSLLVFSISVFFVTGMADVISCIPKEQYDLARTLRMNDWQVLWEVVILGQIDKGFDVLRQNAAVGYMSLTMIEAMSRSEGGIGALLLNSNRHFHLSEVFAIQLLILIIGLTQDGVIGYAKKLICPYSFFRLEHGQ